ncbi:hypothetical protein PENSUB_3082 [Penicillium subrubescens]|uniref:Uncharacterized protein n=1 Tax=Penicillium subrubescens TaxID=1316194 RepID=A0A1Q5UFY6_9EURO|nr:hypothetical protein PENSUB_3082 [Penicillium subrubescens]
MSAQFGSNVKRMRRGFAAQDGRFTILMAETGYIGIKNVFEEQYGVFLLTFRQFAGKEPSYLVDRLRVGLGEVRQSENTRAKSHASMAGTHCTIDTVAPQQN